MKARIARPDELPSLLAVRRVVFVEEQGVPPELEVDGLDPECVHFAVEGPGGLLGTARLRDYHGAGKAERVAVLASARGTGAGRALMEALEAEAVRRGMPEVRLNAQRDAVPFYLRLGYEPVGAEFEEAGIPHLAMRKPLVRRQTRM